MMASETTFSNLLSFTTPFRRHKDAPRWLVNAKPAAYISEMSNKLRLAIHTCTHFLGIPPNILIYNRIVWSSLQLSHGGN